MLMLIFKDGRTFVGKWRDNSPWISIYPILYLIKEGKSWYGFWFIKNNYDEITTEHNISYTRNFKNCGFFHPLKIVLGI